MASLHELVFKGTNSHLSRESTNVSFSRAIEDMAARAVGSKRVHGSRVGRELRSYRDIQAQICPCAIQKLGRMAEPVYQRF
jgi:hypothetical protein